MFFRNIIILYCLFFNFSNATESYKNGKISNPDEQQKKLLESSCRIYTVDTKAQNSITQQRGSLFYGTGFLYRNNTILTALHVLIGDDFLDFGITKDSLNDLLRKAEKQTFVTFDRGSTEVSYKIKKIIPVYKQNKDLRNTQLNDIVELYDLALLVLDENVHHMDAIPTINIRDSYDKKGSIFYIGQGTKNREFTSVLSNCILKKEKNNELPLFCQMKQTPMLTLIDHFSTLGELALHRMCIQDCPQPTDKLPLSYPTPGDSGGPIFQQSKASNQSAYQLIGLISRTNSHVNLTDPAVQIVLHQALMRFANKNNTN